MIKIRNFDLKPGRVIVKKYEVIDKLGEGWEGEVYKIKEIRTGIERAAKFFYPHRNINNKTSRFYARKLHKLRHCSMVIHYHNEEIIKFRKTPVTILVSEYVEGILLADFINKFPGKRLSYFQGLHFLYSLVKGIEEIHLLNEYHGDLHQDNIIVNGYGLRFDLKLLDLFHWKAPRRVNMQGDLFDLIRIFYDSLGGSRRYAKHPQPIKDICCGLKKSLILKKFVNVSQLREYLEILQWEYI